MAQDNFEERTEAATPRRRQEAREQGRVARSADLSSAVILLAAVLALYFLGRSYVAGMSAGTSGVLAHLAEIDGDADSLAGHFGSMAGAVVLGFLPFLAVVVVAALGVNLLQVGFLFAPETMAPKLDRIDPVAGFQRIFSSRSAVRLLGGLLKVAALGVVVLGTVWSERDSLLGLAARPFEEIAGVGATSMFTVAIRATVVLLVLAILEYGYQRWQFERDLRMTRQELREELRRYEGDPRIRERRRVLQRRLAMQRMMQEVPRATVVVTNPTHVSVALRYEAGNSDAPVVTAKGAEDLALRIRETALEHGVPIVERPELARALYATVEVGRAIPMDLYQAVAEVLAYVYRLRGIAAVA